MVGETRVLWGKLGEYRCSCGDPNCKIGKPIIWGELAKKPVARGR